MTVHVSWETLNDVADNRLSASEHANAMAHLTTCDACSAQLNALRALRSAAANTPETIQPPPDAWTEIERSINASKTVAFPPSSAPVAVTRFSRFQVAAAAVVLMAVSSGITAVVMRQPGNTRLAGTDSAAHNAPVVTTAAASEIVLLEEEYLATAVSLRDALNKERDALSPQTIATVERSLKIIDDAIAEARAALMADPANTALREMLRKNHQQKIDFLRRTTSLLEQA